VRWQALMRLYGRTKNLSPVRAHAPTGCFAREGALLFPVQPVLPGFVFDAVQAAQQPSRADEDIDQVALDRVWGDSRSRNARR
jgi:hypothetical protein